MNQVKTNNSFIVFWSTLFVQMAYGIWLSVTSDDCVWAHKAYMNLCLIYEVACTNSVGCKYKYNESTLKFVDCRRLAGSKMVSASGLILDRFEVHLQNVWMWAIYQFILKFIFVFIHTWRSVNETNKTKRNS